MRISLLAEHDGAVDAEILEGKKVKAIGASLQRQTIPISELFRKYPGRLANRRNLE